MSEQEKYFKEKALDDFIDSTVYENASDAIWKLVKAAYNDVWEKARLLSMPEKTD